MSPLAGFSLFALAATHPLPQIAGADGRVHDLLAEARGRPVALVFISHDCPICNTYAPEFARIARQYEGRLVFGIVYAEPGVDSALANRHSREFGLTPIERLLDPKGRLAAACGATVTPEAAVFAPGGRLAYLGRIDDLFYDYGKQRPAATRHDLRRALDSVLNHKDATPAPGPPFGCVIESAPPPQ